MAVALGRPQRWPLRMAVVLLWCEGANALGAWRNSPRMSQLDWEGTRFGILGTEPIAIAMAHGLATLDVRPQSVSFSPELGDAVKELSDELDDYDSRELLKVEFADQDVIDSSDIIFLAIRPEQVTQNCPGEFGSYCRELSMVTLSRVSSPRRAVSARPFNGSSTHCPSIGLPSQAQPVLSRIAFSEWHIVISLMVTAPLGALRLWCSPVPPNSVMRAVALPAVASHRGHTLLMPPHDSAEAIFDALGSVSTLDTEPELTRLVPVSALAGQFQQQMLSIQDWLIHQDVGSNAAAQYVGAAFASFGVPTAKAGRSTFRELVQAQRPGSLNNEVTQHLRDAGVFKEFHGALDKAATELAAAMKRHKEAWRPEEDIGFAIDEGGPEGMGDGPEIFGGGDAEPDRFEMNGGGDAPGMAEPPAQSSFEMPGAFDKREPRGESSLLSDFYRDYTGSGGYLDHTHAESADDYSWSFAAFSCGEHYDDHYGGAEMSRSRRRVLNGAVIASPQPTEKAWTNEWRRRFSCWFKSLPGPTKTNLGGCVGALSLHLGSRLTAAWRAAQSRRGQQLPAAASALKAEAGCEWIQDKAASLEMPEFPEFPADMKFKIPPIPRLIPSWRLLQSSLFRQQRSGGELAYALGVDAPAVVESSSLGASFGVGVGGAAAMSAAAVVIISLVVPALRRRRRRSMLAPVRSAHLGRKRTSKIRIRLSPRRALQRLSPMRALGRQGLGRHAFHQGTYPLAQGTQPFPSALAGERQPEARVKMDLADLAKITIRDRLSPRRAMRKQALRVALAQEMQANQPKVGVSSDRVE